MSYIGIGYSGAKKGLLTDLVRENKSWLSGDRNPRFFGDSFLVMYDSNTAREFAKKCVDADGGEGGIIVYHMERAIKG
jgi:hypothetical protein